MNYAFQELVELAETLGPTRPEIYKCLENVARNPALAEPYLRHFQRLAKNEGFLLRDLPLFSLNLPADRPAAGIHLGTVILGNGRTPPLFFAPASFGAHSLVCGMNRSGKSTFIKYLIPQFLALGIPTWIFDHENEYKSLLRTLAPDKLLILDPETDRDNFLEPPPGVSPLEWKAKLEDTLREQWLNDGSLNLIGSALINLYGNRGVLDGSENYPTILDLLSHLKELQFKPHTRFAGYHESALNRFGGINDNLGRALTCRKGFSLKELAGKCVIYNLRGLSGLSRHFCVNLKMLKLMSYFERLRPIGMRIILIIDEAHKLYNPEIAKRYDLGEPVMFSYARMIAKRGMACIYSDQIPSRLPAALFGNVNNVFAMRLQTAPCMNAISKAMCLDAERARFIPVIPQKQCLARSGDFPDPVLFQIPDLEFDYVTDEEVRAHMEKMLADLEYVPANEEIDISSQFYESKLPGQKKTSGVRPNRLWNETARTVADAGWITLTDLAARLGSLAPWHLRRTLSEMTKQGLIELCPISFGTRGNPRTYAVLAPKGAEFVGLKYEDVKLQGRGSTEHVILQNLLAEEMKNAGKTVAIEHSVNGKAVDIAEIRPDGAIAYEIELAPSHPHVAENVLRDLDAGFDEVIIIARNQDAQNEAKDAIYKVVPWEKLSRVKFKLLREFL
jgi:hypothetical protein